MGVSSTARLPSIGAQSIPQLFNHLQVASNAKVVSRWNVTIRSFRAVPVPTNVWPADGSDSSGHPSSSSSTGPAPLTKPRTMWQIWLSDYPGVVFIIIEDAGKASRAKVWRDWEEQKRAWRARKRQHKDKGSTQSAAESGQGEATAMDVDAPTGEESPGAKPELQVPPHTRYSVTAVTSSMSSMLTSLNLPPPHGAPVGTAGPGAWVPRGAAVSIEGLILEISSQNMNGIGGLVGAASLDDSAGQANIDWRVRVGSVVGGGGRSAGAVVEAEFLPMSALLPTSTYLHNFLQSLFPANIINVPANGSSAFSASGMQTGQAGTTATAPTNNATPSNMTSFTYVIGPNAKLVGNTPNSSFNIPVISDQLWEEVVPRSGATWRNLILSRSRKRLHHNASVELDTNASPFGWHSFGPDHETKEDGPECDSDTESAAVNGSNANGAAAQDDDDDDRPLGAPPATKPAPDTAAEIQLSFEGLRSDFASNSAEQSGWTGIERGRRVAFHYVQMLRAEGII